MSVHEAQRLRQRPVEPYRPLRLLELRGMPRANGTFLAAVGRPAREPLEVFQGKAIRFGRTGHWRETLCHRRAHFQLFAARSATRWQAAPDCARTHRSWLARGWPREACSGTEFFQVDSSVQTIGAGSATALTASDLVFAEDAGTADSGSDSDGGPDGASADHGSVSGIGGTHFTGTARGGAGPDTASMDIRRATRMATIPMPGATLIPRRMMPIPT